MKNFTYRSLDEKENIEEILKRRRRKVNRQQIISVVILIAILGSLALYIGHHVYYTELDGYVHVDTNKVRTPFDIYLDSVYVKTGDLVTPGDTLYSYYMLNLLVENANPDEEPPMVAVSRNYKLQYETARQEIEVLKVRIEELRKQIRTEDHNIALGLSSNSHKLDLERQLNEAEARLKALIAELGALKQTRDETKVVFARHRAANDSTLIPQIYDDARSAHMRRAISYRLASDSSLITDVKAPIHMIFFKEEEILTKQHLNLEANNLKVVAYVPVAKMNKVTNNSTAEIVVNNDVSFKAAVSVLGTRTEMIPENLRSYFSKKNTAVIAIFELDKGQTIPLWALASGMPVSVRIKNYSWFNRDEDTIHSKPDYLWFTTGKGVMTEEKDGHLVPISDTLRNILQDGRLSEKPDTVTKL
ncbi:MAG: SPOR domain-containing protein [Muribaculaceae bacterium]|nr:SPOR domain-containing protein [Muribaculaceae bacterium]MDE6794340.1 SPOR domain-containing protein [Muribaculaceae bacterium]